MPASPVLGADSCTPSTAMGNKEWIERRTKTAKQACTPDFFHVFMGIVPVSSRHKILYWNLYRGILSFSEVRKVRCQPVVNISRRRMRHNNMKRLELFMRGAEAAIFLIFLGEEICLYPFIRPKIDRQDMRCH